MPLTLLANCLEDGRTAIAPALVDPDQRGQFERLQAAGAMATTRENNGLLICPECEARLARLVAAGWARCDDCGRVAVRSEDLTRLAPEGGWLRRRIAQALGLSDATILSVVADRVWRIGDVGQGLQRRRVLFGQQIRSAAVQRKLLDAWAAHVGIVPAMLITTTGLEHFLPGLPAPPVPLSTAFRLRGAGLVADEAVWRGVLAQPVPSVDQAERQGPFSRDFRNVVLPDESEPIPLTPTQSALLRVLWEGEGQRIAGRELMRRARVDLAKPVDAFPKNKYGLASRAYRTLVRSSRRGEYWMPRHGDVTRRDDRDGSATTG